MHRVAPSSDQLVLLDVTAELVVVNTLLQLDKDIVELHVEIRTLLEQHRKLFLHNDGFIDLLEELSLSRILADLGNGCLQALSISHNDLGNLNLLLFERFVLREVGDVFLFELLKHGPLLSLFLMN